MQMVMIGDGITDLEAVQVSSMCRSEYDDQEHASLDCGIKAATTAAEISLHAPFPICRYFPACSMGSQQPLKPFHDLMKCACYHC